MARWIQTDEAEDVAGSVRHALRAAKFTPDDPQAWKWVLLALHSALQGACVCHLVTTASPIGAVTPRNANEWLGYFEASRTDPNARAPVTYLLNLPALVKAIREPRSAGDGSNEAGIAVSDSELEWVCRLHDSVRNQFVHFSPQGWSLEVSGIPDFAKLTARIILEIDNAAWAFRHQGAAWRERLRTDLKRLGESGGV